MWDTGPRDGDVVVLLHGFPQDTASYRLVLPVLHEQGLRTLVPTQRGYAATCRPPSRRAYRLGAVVDDVVALLDAAEVNQAHLVGHDWGGAVAWCAAGRFPDRVQSLTVLSTPHPAAFAGSMWRSGQALKSWYMGFFQLPRLPARLLRRSLRSTLARSGLPAEDVDRYCTLMFVDGAITGALNWYRGLLWGGGPGAGPIEVPTTYMWGNRDFALGRCAAERTGRHVAADYRFDEMDAGHWLPETRPDEVAAAIVRGGR